jgi:hypothetical protein
MPLCVGAGGVTTEAAELVLVVEVGAAEEVDPSSHAPL